MTVHIPVGRSGHSAQVDEDDADLVRRYRWYVKRDHNGKLYARRVWMENGRQLEQFMHNLLMSAVGVDHRDHNGLNNTRANLRLATAQENGANRRPSEGAYKGVQRRGRRWSASIGVAGRRLYLGCFVTAQEAAEAYNSAARMHFGEFACLNQTTEPLEACSV